MYAKLIENLEWKLWHKFIYLRMSLHIVGGSQVTGLFVPIKIGLVYKKWHEQTNALWLEMMEISWTD